jgi:DNA polymerase elongation subunit (family B)
MVLGKLEPDSRISYETWTDPFTRERQSISIVELDNADDHRGLQETLGAKHKIHSLDPLEQMYTRYPDWYCNLAHTNELKCLFFDIEAGSDGGALFPKADRAPVLMIGWAIDDGPIQQLTVTDFGRNKNNDKDLIKAFFDVIRDEDPDLIVTYNGRRFDLPFLLGRAQKHNIDISGLQRASAVFDDVLAGRIHVDLYEDGAVRDMAPFMMGLPNRKMKTVAEAYNIEVGEDLNDEEIRNILGGWSNPEFREKIIRYLDSDVHITRELSKVYTNNLIAIADFNRVPLSAIVDTYKSFIPKLLCTRHFTAMKLTSFLTNKERHNPFNGTITKARLGTPDTEEAGLVYEGAYVDIYKTGLFPNGIWKVDVESFYPSTFRTLNLSPETCTIEKTKAFTGQYKFKREDDILWINIPDERIDRDIIIRIEMGVEGFLAKATATALDERFKLKHALKNMEKHTADYILLDGQQNALKVLLNSIYGLMGQSSSEYGSVACAIACVGMCRFIMKEVLKDMMHCAVETDTDGIYVDEAVDIDEINARIKRLLVANIGIEGWIKMDMDDPYPRGLFIKMKNYILEDDKGKMSLHGATFKNAMHCAGTKKLLRELARIELDGGKQEDRVRIMNTIGNPTTWNLEDFVRTARFKRQAHEYTSWSQVQTSLSEQLTALEGEGPEEGDSVEFIHTTEPWTTFVEAGKIQSTSKQRVALRPWVTRKSQVDLLYYKKEADSILKRFGLSKRDVLEGSIMDLL